MTSVKEVSGVVESVVFKKDSFYIFKFRDDANGVIITVKGSLFGLMQLVPSIGLIIRGSWKSSKYGPQLTATEWLPYPKNVSYIENFLFSCVEGFQNRKLIRRITDMFSLQTFDKLSSLETLKELDATDSDLEGALQSWHLTTVCRDLTLLLTKFGIGSSIVNVLLNKFGVSVVGSIKKNPYLILTFTGNFPKVDKLAFQLGVENPVNRCEGAILWALREMSSQGHLYVRRGDFPDIIEDLLKRHYLVPITDYSVVSECLNNLVLRKCLVLESGFGVYLPNFYEYEKDSAEYLVQDTCPVRAKSLDLPEFLSSYENSCNITLSKDQRLALEVLSKHRILVLTGLPGTGKTMTVRAFVRLFDELGVQYSLMAPTGIAAKRLAFLTQREAYTVHKALRFDGTDWGFGADNKYVVDAVVVDEVSMMDQELLYRLLRALRSDTILVLVGDDAQLPSVGPGNVLRELVASGLPHVRLTQIFRQSEESAIVSNSHRIQQGVMPVLANSKDVSEFKFVEVSNETTIVDLIVKMSFKLKSKKSNFQVISPMYKGSVGVDNLNDRLRDELNPSGKEWKFGSCHFRVGDRLMVIQNDYTKNVYNGNMCKLVDISSNSLEVQVYGLGYTLDMIVSFPFETAAQRLKLAYCVSVHKCQGSEFDTVIMPVVRSQGRMLQRNLVYTAVTRAKKQVWLIGDSSALQKAIDNNKVIDRNTRLADRIQVLLSQER